MHFGIAIINSELNDVENGTENIDCLEVIIVQQMSDNPIML